MERRAETLGKMLLLQGALLWLVSQLLLSVRNEMTLGPYSEVLRIPCKCQKGMFSSSSLFILNVPQGGKDFDPEAQILQWLSGDLSSA